MVAVTTTVFNAFTGVQFNDFINISFLKILNESYKDYILNTMATVLGRIISIKLLWYSL